MKKKIGILTQPLHDNYGGLLQAFALSKTLVDLGFDPWIINRRTGHANPVLRKISRLKNNLIGQKYILSKAERNYISKYNLEFIEKYIPNLTGPIYDDKQLSKLRKSDFSGFIVGSDQCWRPKYSPKISNYFLDFIYDIENVKKIAYAASFGTDKWEFSQNDTEKCKELIKKFDAVSVREDSGVNLCDKFFEAQAIHVLDPTMLLDQSTYAEMAQKSELTGIAGDLMIYILDKNSVKNEIVNYVEKRLTLKQFEILPKNKILNIRPDNLKDYQYPSPLDWLKGFFNSKFVITDSFHGTVFSIIFNKPFISIGNEKRGLARFNSVLSLFNLNNRLINKLDFEKMDRILSEQIDWNSVNSSIQLEKSKSLKFLIENL